MCHMNDILQHDEYHRITNGYLGQNIVLNSTLDIRGYFYQNGAIA